MIEVDQVEHAFDDGCAVSGLHFAERGEDGRPGQPDEDVGNGMLGLCAATGSGDALVIGDQVGAPCCDKRCHSVAHVRKRSAGRAGQQSGHGIGCRLGRDDGGATGGDGIADVDRQRQRAGHRHGEVRRM